MGLGSIFVNLVGALKTLCTPLLVYPVSVNKIINDMSIKGLLSSPFLWRKYGCGGLKRGCLEGQWRAARKSSKFSEYLWRPKLFAKLNRRFCDTAFRP